MESSGNSPQNITPITTSTEVPSVEVQVLRNLFVGTLAALLLVSGSFMLFMYVQMGMVRGQLAEQRPAVLKAVQDYKQISVPLIQKFSTKIQAYATTHPDFRPIWQKYEPSLSDVTGNPSVTPVSPQPAATNK
ncbi:MAG TPA: hypothetical protein VMZ27_03620 [Candidatus Saccharimonadales bacterium]|nr:hypothetical protein [Candidatus Saccharimonadales bacterium]